MLDHLKALRDKKVAFVVYKLPNSNEVKLFYQENDELHLSFDFSEAGFLMAPFADTDFYSFIPNTHQDSFTIVPEEFNSGKKVIHKEENKALFIDLVHQAKQKLEQTELQKVVISRVINHKVPDKNPLQTFQNLLKLYSDAFVYLWHHPQTGSWMGATPERFINLNKGILKTTALAGTTHFEEGKKAEWTEKEIEEQQLVTDDIKSSLIQMLPELKIDVGTLKSTRAGALWHLNTNLETKHPHLKLLNIVKALHPTPAVGGVPKDLSIKFINKNEGYDRKFYTGFLGPFGANKQADLFVNLRCAEFTPSGYNVYVGAGITSKSNPESEWQETQRKANTFCKAL
ncbi:isochorismate synthase [Flavobacteriaceae bacterium]|nr:isochorismate synthase [Flavobacteriaceae bacterium]